MLKIAILDDYAKVALQSADWSVLQGKAEITVFDRHLSENEAATLLQPFDVFCTVRERMSLPRSLFQRLPKVFCPHAIGMKRDREHCLGFQFAGGSSSGLPSGGEWRCFDVNGLTSIFTGSGPWHTGANYTQPQSCVDIIDAEVSY
jgi:hypothetical protein